tara:strand:+ start:328217 stop:328846 length:630 start_codon:yes stop_codon:yes gene_type:complete
MNSSTSVFVTVDGIDGVGKSTQIDRLTQHLADCGHDVITVQDPGSSEIGKRLRELLLDSDLEMHRRTEAMLFMASRSEMIESTIRPALAEGKSVISDRFLLANVVYQSIGTDDVTAELLWRLGRLAAGELRPALTILLDMPAEAAMRRVGDRRDRMESRGVAYMESVRQAFLEQLPESSEHTIVVNANQDVEQVTAEMLAAVDSFLASR